MRATVIVAIVALSGCASSKTVPQRPTSDETVRIAGPQGIVVLTTSPTVTPSVDTVLYSLDKVWSVLPAVFDSLAIPVTSVDSANHIIGAADLKVRRRLGDAPLGRYLDCGDSQGVPSAETYEIQLSVLTRVHPGAPGTGTTTVATTIEASGRPVSFAGEYVRCSSTRALESRLVKTLKALSSR